jgi:hypothetical protein
MVDVITQLESVISTNWSTGTHTPKPAIYLMKDTDDLGSVFDKEYVSIIDMVDYVFMHKKRNEIHHITFILNTVGITGSSVYVRKNSMLEMLSLILQGIENGTYALTGITGFTLSNLTQEAFEVLSDGATYRGQYTMDLEVDRST